MDRILILITLFYYLKEEEQVTFPEMRSKKTLNGSINTKYSYHAHITLVMYTLIR